MPLSKLQQLKIKSLDSHSWEASESMCLNFNFHEVPIKFYSEDPSLLFELNEYIPSSWKKKTQEAEIYKIIHRAPANLVANIFDNESSSEVFYHQYEHKKEAPQVFAVQRDFVSAHIESKKTYHCIFKPKIDDGLHNFLRWMLSPLLLLKSRVMLHSAALVCKEGEVFLFLGPSGAGKTTITELGNPRLILSDDMNLVKIDGDKITCSAGGVGGLYKPQVSLDKEFSIKRIFWLNQSNENYVDSLSTIKQTQFLLASFANLPWRLFDKHFQNLTIETAQSILKVKNIDQLNFRKSKDIWHLLDSLVD